jgi:hypothetical protein
VELEDRRRRQRPRRQQGQWSERRSLRTAAEEGGSGRSEHAREGGKLRRSRMGEEEDNRSEKREERWMAHLSVRERERRG